MKMSKILLHKKQDHCRGVYLPPSIKGEEIFPLYIGYSCTTLRVKKFTQNRSISYGFQDIHTFSFSAKIQDGHQKWQKLKLFPFA